VSGQAGNVRGRRDTRGNIFEGARARVYPMPPLRSTGFIDHMTAAARKTGLHPFPGPAAITSRPYDGRPACLYHGYCLGAGCHVNAKSATAVTTIPKAQATKRLTIVTAAHVTRVESDAEGRVTGVTYGKGGEEFFQPASAVLIAGYTYENVRLLLLSASKAYPRGLSNNHGQVGRHYFSHNQGGGVSALFPTDLNVWYGTPGQGVNVDDWADDNFDHRGLDFIGGGSMWVYAERRPMSAVNATQAFLQGRRAWGSEWKAFVKQNANRIPSCYLQKTTLPYEDNYLDLDPVAKDALGFPVIRITAEFKENERRIARFIADKMRAWFMEAGAVAVSGDGNIGAAMGVSTHAYGGTRMGDNAETNVVNRWGFSHEAPNLAVLGASTMGTSGARNPTLTAQALAWRTAEYLAKNWRSVTG
jgi:gluconate 2-dehydrogenase alpha chain